MCHMCPCTCAEHRLPITSPGFGGWEASCGLPLADAERMRQIRVLWGDLFHLEAGLRVTVLEGENGDTEKKGRCSRLTDSMWCIVLLDRRRGSGEWVHVKGARAKRLVGEGFSVKAKLGPHSLVLRESFLSKSLLIYFPDADESCSRQIRDELHSPTHPVFPSSPGSSKKSRGLRYASYSCVAVLRPSDPLRQP